MSLINQNGIALEGSTASNNQIYSNIFQQDTVAITLTASSTSNIVFNNIITSNSIGLDVESSGNVVCANMMTENQVAISIENSNNNKFFHNDFVSNDVQLVIAASTGNVWDDGYPSGGNYWSGHTGPDMFSGPNQDQAGSDGIVDISYTIATGSVDRYPLAHGAHDVGITSVTMSKTVVGKGCTLHVELKILNYGMYDENFPVAAYANTSTAATQSIALTKGSYIIVTLTWNTSSLAYGNYTISAYAWPVPDEANTADNTYIYGLVSVTIIGDVDGNVNVNVLDAIDVSNSFGKSIGQTGFNPNADFDDNGVINILDAITLANNFGQHYP
jgi:parallel beta-helix repeat protein